jgi:hypothetical protein
MIRRHHRRGSRSVRDRMAHLAGRLFPHFFPNSRATECNGLQLACAENARGFSPSCAGTRSRLPRINDEPSICFPSDGFKTRAKARVGVVVPRVTPYPRGMQSLRLRERRGARSACFPRGTRKRERAEKLRRLRWIRAELQLRREILSTATSQSPARTSNTPVGASRF